jgi:hypothetical protein
MSMLTDSDQWEALRRELESVAQRAKAFNAYVFDAWDNQWCAARGFSDVPRDDLVDIVHTAIGRRTPLRRGGTLDTVVSGRTGHAYLKSFGSCYVLLLRYAGGFDDDLTRTVVMDELARIEALTMALPSPDGPGSDATDAAKRA